jgi:hypothetical protein
MRAAVVLAAGWALTPLSARAQAPPGLFARRYVAGEELHYVMEATNENRQHLLRYHAQADGVVGRDSLGRFVEQFEWSHLVRNDTVVNLLPGSAAVRQRLTLAPEYMIPLDIRAAHPRLVGPVLDLLTFYVDLWMAAKLPLAHAGDHFAFPGSGSSSWADGRILIIGEDAIDFDVTLTAVDSAGGMAKLTVRHVPPAQARVHLPADWMKVAAYDSPNNWVEVTRTPDGGYVASIGRETFDVTLTVNLNDGRLLSADMDNPVDVLERVCSDSALSTCGEPVRYRIFRRIALR